MRRMTIRVLGPFEVTIDGAPASGFAYAKVRALLAYLAVEAPRPQARAALAALLWPDQPEANARGSLSQALLNLRNILGDKGAAEPLLLADAHHVRFNPRCAVEVDATAFHAALDAAEAHPHHSWRTCAACAERLQQALGQYRGGFLDDVAIPDSAEFEEWASLHRAQLLQRALSGLARLAERAAWCGATAEALAYARRLVALDPLLEASQRTMLRLLALNGEPAAALAQYRQLQDTLAQELAAAPEEATTALYEQIRRGDLAGLQPTPPPFAAPLPAAPLLGREEPLQAIRAHLRDGAGRLLTITGAGGIGKTRLALAAAHDLRYDFADGVALVELAALNSPALVAATIARALGIKEHARQPLGETLQTALRARHMLLILDNFEHVLAAAPLVAELLAACPALHILATSRSPLQVRAERQLNLDPLADAAAVQLFLQRAQAAGAELGAGEEEAAIYTAICRRLDRLPLAIELIAVRTRALTPRELLEQLERPLEVLAQGPRDVAPRHQSLREVIRWSYDLLSPEEQRVFRALGVFAGGAALEAAQAVAGPGVAVLEALEALHHASLVQPQLVAGQTRFVMLETIREFALGQLTVEGEAPAARQRHAAHFADFAMAAEAELVRAEAWRWRAWVDAEQGNLREAFIWAEQHAQHELMLRLATGVWRFHYSIGAAREALARVEAGLAYRERVPLGLQLQALKAAGTLAGGLNDYARLRQWLGAAVEVGWRLGDQEALQMVMNNFGLALLEQGELEDARVYLEVSLSLARRGADPTRAKFPLGVLAGLHHRLGEHEQARALGEECLRLNQERGDPEGTANALRTLGNIALAQGDPARARELGAEALATHRTLSHQLGVGQDLALLGDVARAEGDHLAALDLYQQCLRLWRDHDNIVNSAAVLDRVAQAVSELGDAARAATLAAAAGALRELATAKLTDAERAARDRMAATCRAALGAGAFADARAAGRALSMAQALALALEPLEVAAC